MGENDKANRIKFLVGGAIGGAIIGLPLGNIFLGSSVGIVLAVLVGTRYLETA